MVNLVNTVKLVGNVGQDPILETAENGSKYLSFSLATNEGYKNAKGERIEKTVWHNCICYGKTAELYFDLLRKGSHIVLGGVLTYSNYKHESGIKMTSTSIKANDMLLLDKKPTNINEINVNDPETVS